VARILIVDDDEGIRSFLTRKLTQAGHAVREAENGAVASRIMRGEPFDLIITDIFMPDKEGLETIMELKGTTTPDLKIIAMSGGGIGPADEYLSIARRLGADSTISKPFSLEELFAKIAALTQ
jgi:DNA-binding response OmpR family regulator